MPSPRCSLCLKCLPQLVTLPTLRCPIHHTTFPGLWRGNCCFLSTAMNVSPQWAGSHFLQSNSRLGLRFILCVARACALLTNLMFRDTQCALMGTAFHQTFTCVCRSVGSLKSRLPSLKVNFSRTNVVICWGEGGGVLPLYMLVL